MAAEEMAVSSPHVVLKYTGVSSSVHACVCLCYALYAYVSVYVFCISSMDINHASGGGGRVVVVIVVCVCVCVLDGVLCSCALQYTREKKVWYMSDLSFYLASFQ